MLESTWLNVANCVCPDDQCYVYCKNAVVPGGTLYGNQDVYYCLQDDTCKFCGRKVIKISLSMVYNKYFDYCAKSLLYAGKSLTQLLLCCCSRPRRTINYGSI
jgi:hypothetical protein